MISSVSSSSQNNQILSRQVTAQQQDKSDGKRLPPAITSTDEADSSQIRAQGAINSALMGVGQGGPDGAGGPPPGGAGGPPPGGAGGPEGQSGTGQVDSKSYLVDLLSDDSEEEYATSSISTSQTDATASKTLEELLSTIAAG